LQDGTIRRRLRAMTRRAPLSCCTLTLVAGMLLAVSGCAGQPAPAVAAPPAVPAAAGTGTADSDPRVLGAEDAPVTIIEFTDLQCPYCARFARETWPRLRTEYVDTGKVRFATRDLPLPFHAFALPAAVAARCAGAQGRYWEYRDALFAAQSRLGSEPYAGLAAQLGLDAAGFEACRADPATLEAVRADAALATANGITGTPSFVIGRVVDGEFAGELVSGAGSFEQFAARIDALLQAQQ
jgi:protein-disulfide isomerase